MRRYIRPVLIVATAVLLVAVGALLLLGRHYEPEVKEALVRAVNQRLDVPVDVRDMDLTLIARFPMAGLRLHDVLAMEKRSDDIVPDTLLFARELYLEFSLWSLFRGDYTIERIHGSTVTLRPGIDGQGKENYLILKTDSTASGNADIALEKVSFDDLDLRFRDARNGLDLRAHSRSLKLSGQFGSALNTLDLEGDLKLAHYDLGDVRILDERQGHLRLEMAFGGTDGAFRITRGEVVAGGLPLELTLELMPDENGQRIDLRCSGMGISLEQLAAILPGKITAPINGYELKGTADIALRYHGPLEAPGPLLAMGAKVVNGHMREKRSGTVFRDIHGELALDINAKGEISRLVVRDLAARSGSGSLGGNWESTGLVNAPLKADLHVDMALADLLRFAQVDTLEQVSGRLKAKATAEGRLRDVADFRTTDLRALRIGGSATMRNASLKLKGVRHRVEHLDADLVLEGNDAHIQGLSAVVQGSPLELRGTLRNLMPYLLFEQQQLAIDAEASSSRIDLATLLRSGTAAKGETRSYAITLPSTIELDLRASVDELVFEEFIATDIRGTLRMKDRVLRASPVTLNTASGAMLGSLELDARGLQGGDHTLAIEASFQDIDIKQLFREFQDFGQEFIGHRHLSGASQARVELRAPITPAMSVVMDRLTCTVDIAIDNGGIRDHKPLMEVAAYLRNNRLVAPFVNTDALRDRLADVRFERLENRIEIRDGAVHVPTMEVRSSALDLELSGTHWFDDRIDHHLNFRLGDLFRLGKQQNEEFGPIVDDGTGMRLFLHMYGTANDPQFANDGAMAAQRRRNQFQQEKQELKRILREDLGLFQGKAADGEAAVGDTPPKAQPRFEVDWNTSDSTDLAEPGGAVEKRRGLGRLLDRVTKESEPEERYEVIDP